MRRLREAAEGGRRGGAVAAKPKPRRPQAKVAVGINSSGAGGARAEPERGSVGEVMLEQKPTMLKIKKLQQGKKKVDKEQKVALMKKHLTAIGRHIAKSAKARGHDAAKEIQLWNYAARKSGLKSGEAMKAIFERLSGTEN